MAPTNHSVLTGPLGTEDPETNIEATPQSLMDEKQFQKVLVTEDGEPN